MQSIASRLYQFSSVGCVLGIHYANDNFASIGFGSSLPLFVASFFVEGESRAVLVVICFPSHIVQNNVIGYLI